MTGDRDAVSAYLSEIGQRGGRIGGKRRLDTMTPEQRTEQASHAARARWHGSGPLFIPRAGDRFTFVWWDGRWRGCVVDRVAPKTVFWHYPAYDGAVSCARRIKLTEWHQRCIARRIVRERP